MLTKDLKILIVGLGLIGGSYAQGLSEKGYTVGALDVNEDSIKYGLENNIIKMGQTVPDEKFLHQFDIVIFSLYPHVFTEWIKKYQDMMKPKTILMDVTGVKKWIICEIEKIIRKDIYFVGTHPMAGREVYGVKNADKNIFKGANYIVTPTHSSTKEAIEVSKGIAKALEFKNIVELNADEHDEMIGFLSQLTHCIAISLMTCKDSEHLVEYTGDSFRDLTRIARINENMWSELFLLNKKELVDQISLFEEQLAKLKNYIVTEYIEEMKEMMKLSTVRRSYFDK